MMYYILGIIEQIGSTISDWAWDKMCKIRDKEQEKIQKWLRKK